MLIILFFIMVIIVTFAYLIGFIKLIGGLFYIVSFHWLLKLIIKIKQDQKISQILTDGLTDVLDNDEEMAVAAVDSDNEIQEQQRENERKEAEENKKTKKKTKRKSKSEKEKDLYN